MGVGVELGEWTSDGMGDHLDLGSYLFGIESQDSLWRYLQTFIEIL